MGGMGHSFPSPESACPSGSLDRPGGTRTDEPREKAPFSSSAKSPQDPSRPGGRHHKHGRDQKTVSVGFLSKNAPPGFRVRASFVPSWETRFPPSDVKR